MIEVQTRRLRYGTQTVLYELSYDGRKTLGISVLPDLRVAVVAPPGTPVEEIEARLARRARWILSKQRQYERYLPHLPPRQYVSGETHRYLGRQHRLKVLASPEEVVTLERGYIYVRLPDPSRRQRVRELLEAWYAGRAGEVFGERLAACFPKMQHTGVPYPDLAIRVLSTRWGMTNPSGRITLNVKLIQVPRAYIDYVIYHELCHLKQPNHGPEYYRLLDRVLPDWRERRARLNGFEFG